MAEFARLFAQFVGGAQGQMASSSKSDDSDRHLQSFLRLQPPRFKGAATLQEAEDWLQRLEKSFDSFQCPVDRMVPLAAFVLDGEAECWWRGQRRTRFQDRSSLGLQRGCTVHGLACGLIWGRALGLYLELDYIFSEGFHELALGYLYKRNE